MLRSSSPSPALRVARGQHQVEQVVAVGRVRAAVGDDAVDQRVHLGDVGVERALRLLGEALLDRQPGDHVERFAERAAERLEKAVELVLLEAVERVAEPGERDAVERQPRHVVGDLDVGPRQPVPLGDQLVAHLQDHVVVAAHRPLAERGQQDAVRAAPVRLLGEGGEQPVAGEAPDDPQARSRHLAEARFVAEFGDEIGGWSRTCRRGCRTSA